MFYLSWCSQALSLCTTSLVLLCITLPLCTIYTTLFLIVCIVSPSTCFHTFLFSHQLVLVEMALCLLRMCVSCRCRLALK